MEYEKLKPAELFEKIKSEDDARVWLWRARSGGKDWACPNCTHRHFYEYKTRPDIRECRLCMRRFRVRAGTLFEHSKLPLLTWMRALYFATLDKRGISALQLQRLLDLGSYRTAWRMLHKIRRALCQRDERYKLSGLVELDGAYFASVATEDEKGQATCLVAIESKAFVDEKGRPKQRAGFAKVSVTGSESKIFAQKFVDQNIKRRSFVNTDAGNALIRLKHVRGDYQVVQGDEEILDRWLPWVHREAEKGLIGAYPDPWQPHSGGAHVRAKVEGGYAQPLASREDLRQPAEHRGSTGPDNEEYGTQDTSEVIGMNEDGTFDVYQYGGPLETGKGLPKW